MDGRTLKALCIWWAKETERVDITLSQAFVKFREAGENTLMIYTDPEDILLFCEDLVGADPIKFFTEYILFYDSLH